MATSLVHSLGLTLPALTSASRGPPSLLPHALSQGEATPQFYSFPMSRRLNIKMRKADRGLDVGRDRALAAEGGDHLDEALRGLDEGKQGVGRLLRIQFVAIEHGRAHNVS